MSKGCGCYSRMCPFNVLNGPEARPEGRGQRIHIPAPTCASRTTFPNQLYSGHQKSTGRPQTIPQKTGSCHYTKMHSVCSHKNFPTPTHTMAHLTSCVGGATPPSHKFTCILLLSSFLSPRQPHDCTLPH